MLGKAQNAPVLRRLSRDRHAAAAMEFALVLPVFLVMMCGTLQYGILFYTWNVALNGARNAARALAVGRVDEAGAEAMMIAALPPWVTAGGSSPDDGGDRDCGGGNGDPDDTGGYGPGGCGAGNGNGGGNGNGNGSSDDDGDVSATGDISATATDAEVGGDVSAALVFPSARATFLPLAPMPDNVRVQVQMVKEA